MTWKYFELLALSAGVTAVISALAIAFGLAISVPVAAASLARHRLLRRLGRSYISFFRGVPLLVQLMLLYYLLPGIGINLPNTVTAVVGLALCTAAYQAENLRGGFLNVAPGLVEAARMVGLADRQILLRIRLPIAFRLVLPAVVIEAILILKSSSLVSVVGVSELTRMAQNLSTSTFKPLDMYAMAGLLYLVLNWIIATGGLGLERMLHWGRR
jgi:polar amino acid transport system permease protein